MSRATRFLDACFSRPTDCTPVWLMRQAGRYQPSYRALRQKVSFLELCKTPELAARVTVDAVNELDADAAILFSDILIAVESMGAPLEIGDEGPSLSQPVRTRADVDRLRVPDPTQAVPFVLETVRLVRRALAGGPPLIGFAGGPVTLASYLVEGGHSRSYENLKRLLFTDGQAAHALFDKLARTVAAQLRAQVEAGCQAVQLFDSWAGILSPRDYRSFALPYTQRIFAELDGLGVPRILFGTETSALLEIMRESGAEVIGLDWRIEIGEGRRRLGPAVAVQGNLDPAALFLEPQALEERVSEILAQAGPVGHVFNLGHGVLPPTDPARARFLVDAVHRLSRAARTAGP